MTHYEVTHGKGFRLADHDPRADSGIGGKAEGRAEVAKLTARLEELHELLYADGRYKVLVVLQGMDTSGKGGAIRKAFEGLDPTGVHVATFKAPTEAELAHDFLWRIHPHVPENGQHLDLRPQPLRGRADRAGPRPGAEGALEGPLRPHPQLRADAGRRGHGDPQVLPAHLEGRAGGAPAGPHRQPDTSTGSSAWRTSTERERWDDYQPAYEEAIRRTATPDAPWIVVPADRKWHRDLVICRTMVETLEGLDLRYPESDDDLSGITVV